MLKIFKLKLKNNNSLNTKNINNINIDSNKISFLKKREPNIRN